ncbi:MAG: polysaccharide deacetylase family protein [Clostridiales bacterium]|nr:polysaccharide deacetylase family protein [Clostridiales bacterium]
MYIIKLKSIFIGLAVLICVLITAGVWHRAVETFAPGEETVSVPVLMYHIVLENPDGNKYTVSPADFENDLKFLSSRGYTAIVIQDLINYVQDGAALPEKPVILTFDDGYYNNYVYVYPLLRRYGAKAVISIVGSYTDTYTENGDTNVGYAYLSWDNAREMAQSGLVEIQNHSYDLHSLGKGRQGAKKKSGESSEEYMAFLTRDIGSMQEKCLDKLGFAPTAFTYPFGLISNESADVIKALGFKASLSCAEGINEITKDPEQLYMLKRCIRTPSRSAADILSR